MTEKINNPEHYTKGGIECIDYIKAKLTHQEYIGFLKGNAIKYLSRAGSKGEEIEDIKKAQWYINRLSCYKELKSEICKNHPDCVLIDNHAGRCHYKFEYAPSYSEKKCEKSLNCVSKNNHDGFCMMANNLFTVSNPKD